VAGVPPAEWRTCGQATQEVGSAPEGHTLQAMTTCAGVHECRAGMCLEQFSAADDKYLIGGLFHVAHGLVDGPEVPVGLLVEGFRPFKSPRIEHSHEAVTYPQPRQQAGEALFLQLFSVLQQHW
jgi:hypothetical protein